MDHRFKYETKLLEENIQAQGLVKSPQTWDQRHDPSEKNIKKLYCIKIKNFGATKDSVRKEKKMIYRLEENICQPCIC